jgi:hypothetical protein
MLLLDFGEEPEVECAHNLGGPQAKERIAPNYTCTHPLRWSPTRGCWNSRAHENYSEAANEDGLWMVWTYAQVGKQQLLAARTVASPVWFHGYKNRVNVFERLRIAGFQNPALLTDVVFVENSET